MEISPVNFAKEFAKFQYSLSRREHPELQLLYITEFYLRYEPILARRQYESYLLEILPLFNHLITDRTLFDLSLEELEKLSRALNVIRNTVKSETDYRWLIEKYRKVNVRRTTLWLCVGDIKKALGLCIETAGSGDVKPPDSDSWLTQDPLESFMNLTRHYKSSEPVFAETLKLILDAWEREIAFARGDGVLCLFVERGYDGQLMRGRLRKLTGLISFHGAKKTGSEIVDTVTFDNQIKSPDDPFVGAAYDSLEAVRGEIARSEFKSISNGSFQAYFSIQDSASTFTGDSIGLAFGLLAYIQLLKIEITRHSRYLADGVALTGGLDREGNVLPINRDTLTIKLKRSFFSAARHIVVPADVYSDSRNCLKELSGEYPRRQYRLLCYNKFSDVASDLNIVRAADIGLSRFVLKKAHNFARMTKVQIPLLLLSIYVLVSLIYPKAWIGFDWNPRYVKQSQTAITAMNADSIPLWSREFDGQMRLGSYWQVGDINNDGKNEVAFIPCTDGVSEINANLFVYDSSGKLSFRRYCPVLDEYPGDTSSQLYYSTGLLDIADSARRKIIITMTHSSYPARSHFRIWSPEGDLLGWYINSGFYHDTPGFYSTAMEDRLLFLSINNRLPGAVLFALDPDSSYGVSPPYSDSTWDLTNVKRGNQLQYVLFPRTDINRLAKYPYNFPASLYVLSDNIIQANIAEDYWRDDKSKAVFLSYFFDKNLRIIDIKISDDFNIYRNELIDKGMLPPLDLQTYIDSLQNRIAYWTGSGWVTEAELREREKNGR